jgi:phosphatidylserine/phosphatidylglycerophosphate/cardiolipin synthase-like enzyme
LINASKSAIYIEVDQLKDSDIINALIAAKKRGCSIQIIINPSSALAELILLPI